MEQIPLGQLIDPLDPAKYNAFALDDYLRVISSPEGRAKLIREHGFDPESTARYEEENCLPPGAFELAIMMSDPRVQDVVAQLQERTLRDMKEGKSPSPEVMEQDASVQRGFAKLYPNAFRFLTQYQAQMQADDSRTFMFSQAYYQGEDDICNVIVCVHAVLFLWVIAIVAYSVNVAKSFNVAININVAANATTVCNVEGYGTCLSTSTGGVE